MIALHGGALGVLAVALKNFSCKLRLIFFTALVCRCTHCTPGYAYVSLCVGSVSRVTQN